MASLVHLLSVDDLEKPLVSYKKLGQLHSLPTLATHQRGCSVSGHSTLGEPIPDETTANIRSSLTLLFYDDQEESRFHNYFYNDDLTLLFGCALTGLFLGIFLGIVSSSELLDTVELNPYTVGFGAVSLALHLLASIYFFSRRRDSNAKQTIGAPLPGDPLSDEDDQLIPWISSWMRISFLEVVFISIVSSLFLVFVGIVHGKTEVYCDAKEDRSLCAKFIRADGAMCIIYILVVAIYRPRFIVTAALMTGWTAAFLVHLQTPLAPRTTPSYKRVFSILFGVLNTITLLSSYKNDLNARDHYWSMLTLKGKRQKAKALESFYASIAGSMIPEPVARRMAKGEMVRDQLLNVIVCCFGLKLTKLAESEGPSAMVMAIQRCMLLADSALRIVKKECQQLNINSVVTKYHTFGGTVMLCVRSSHESHLAHTISHLLLRVFEKAPIDNADCGALMCSLDVGDVLEVTFDRVKNFVAVGQPVDRAMRALERLCEVPFPASCAHSRISVPGSLAKLLRPSEHAAGPVFSPTLWDLREAYQRFSSDSSTTHEPVHVVMYPALLLWKREPVASCLGVSEMLGRATEKQGTNRASRTPTQVLFVGNINPLMASTSTRNGESERNASLSSAPPATDSSMESDIRRALVPVACNWLPIRRFQSSEVETDFQGWRRRLDENSIVTSFASLLLVALALVLSCVVEEKFSDAATLLSAGAGVVAALGLVAHPFLRTSPVLVYALEAVYYGMYLLAFVLASDNMVISSDVRLWVSTILLLSSLRDRAILEALWPSTLVDVAITVPFLAYIAFSPRLADSFLTRVSLGIVTLIACVMFRWFIDRMRRERYRTEKELMDVQQQLVRDSTGLAVLLNKMVPSLSRGQLFAKLLQAIRLHDCSSSDSRMSANQSVAHAALVCCPKLFGIRGSLFATRAKDTPLLLITVRSDDGMVAHAEYALVDRDGLMQRVNDALGFSEEASIVKTNGDVVMIASETTRGIDEQAATLLDVVARLGCNVPHGERNRLHCVLTSGPTMAGVLGTSSLSYEYYGLPILVAQRLLRDDLDDSGLWGAAPEDRKTFLRILALERFCELIQWMVVDDVVGTFAAKASMSDAMRNGFEMGVTGCGDVDVIVSFGPVLVCKVKGLTGKHCVRRIDVRCRANVGAIK